MAKVPPAVGVVQSDYDATSRIVSEDSSIEAEKKIWEH
jgi:hypothetical protein